MSNEIQIPEWVEKYLANAANLSCGLITQEKRRLAMQSINGSGLPNRSNEDWKYTDLSAVLADKIIASEQGSTQKPQNLDVLPKNLSQLLNIKSAGRIVFVDGILNRALSSSVWPTGVALCDFQTETASKYNEQAAALLTKAANIGITAFSDLNLACSQDVYALVIEKNIALAEPIVMLSLTSSAAHQRAVFPRFLVQTQDNSAVTLLEVHYALDQQTYFSASVGEYFVETGSVLNHLLLNLHNDTAISYSNSVARLAKDCKYKTYIFNLGGALVRNDVQATLDGQGSYAEICGLSLLEEKQQVDNHTVLDHAQANCDSFELFKGIYAGSSKGIFDGTIIVRPDAQKTNAIQSNRSLLLSDKATSYAKPQLKIWADDVKCTHGATVGQLDQQALFYIRSRGISEKEASEILQLAFISEVIERVEHLELRGWLQAQVVERLGSLK